jgi:large subunit ribosomal protein L32
MGLPAKRRTKTSKRERASHFALKKFSLIKCSHCARRIRPHVVCPHCGYYRGRAVLKISSKVEKRSKKSKEARGEHADHDHKDAKVDKEKSKK